MKTLNHIIALLFLLGTTAAAQEKPKVPAKEEVLRAVKVFAKSSLTAEGKVAAKTILKFAEGSDDVSVVISPSVIPWVESEQSSKFRGTLLAAYIAGNVGSQLSMESRATIPTRELSKL